MDNDGTHDTAPPQGRLVVHWSNSDQPPPVVRFASRQRIGTTEAVAITAVTLSFCCTVSLVNLGLPHAEWLAIAPIVIILVMFFQAFRKRQKWVTASPVQEQLLEDDGVVEKAIVHATFRPLGAPEGQDRGVLTLIEGSLAFVGAQASCTISLAHRHSTKCDHATPGRQGSITIEMPNGDEVVFEFLNSNSDPSKSNEDALMRAVRMQTLEYVQRRRQAELPNQTPDR